MGWYSKSDLGSDLWKKFRALCFRLLGERCMGCDDGSAKSLAIHHRFYEDGKRAWEYPIDTIEVLCTRCHPIANKRRRDLVRATGRLNASVADRAVGYMRGLEAEHVGPVGSIRVDSCEFAGGIGDVFHLTEKQVLAMIGTDRRIQVADLFEARNPVDMDCYRRGLATQ